jgi:signal peptidase II
MNRMVQIGILALLLALDFLTKSLAIKHIPFMLPKIVGYPFGGIPLFDLSQISFSLNRVYNTGAAWGLFQGHSGALFLLRSAIIAGLIVYLIKQHKKEVKLLPLHLIPFWLIAAGAIGNSIDYLLYGHVVDFLHFTFGDYSFPVFNLADSYITIGVFALILFPKKAPLHSHIS